MNGAWLNPAAAFALALAVSWLLTRTLVRWAPQLGLVDLPSDRKVHTQPTPRGGGIAIVAAILCTQLLPFLRWPDAGLTLSAGVAVALLGLADDWRPLPWYLRLAAQAVATVGVLALGGQVSGVAAIAGIPEGSPLWMPWPLAVLWIVGLTNAFNMLDNMDALSAGTAWIAAGVLAGAAAARSPQGTIAVLPYAAFMGSVSGFLWFNRPPARIFMGDVGSTFLGFFLSVRSLRDGLARAGEPGTWILPLCAFALPLYDMTTVVLLRLSQGRSPFHADKQHVSHRLAALGLGSVRAVRALHAAALATGVAGLILWRLPEVGAGTLLGTFAAIWLALVGVEWQAHRLWRARTPTPVVER